MTDPGPALTLGRMLDRTAERFPYAVEKYRLAGPR